MTATTEAPPAASSSAGRYSAVAAALHWLIALAIVAQIGVGWYMGDMEDHSPAQRAVEGFHISFGLTILALTVMRLIWRLVHAPPPSNLPAGSWERRLSLAIHGLFYVLLLAIPLTGWVMESFGPRPIPFWGAAWPHVPGVAALFGDGARDAKGALEEIHGSPLVWAMIVLIGLHVLGALKHQFDGRPVLWRMVPFLKRPPTA